MSERDYAVEDFLIDSNKLLDDIQNTDSFIFDLPGDKTADISEAIRKKSIESMNESLDLQVNGHASVTVSDDEMEAVADLFPPSDGMEPLRRGHVAELLHARRVIYGVLQSVIDETILKCNTEFEPVTGIVVARGSRPTDEVPEHLRIEENLLRNKGGQGQESRNDEARIDFKSVSPFVLVKKGDVLARVVPTIAGQAGSTVT
ncbi:MAG: DUF342 domain-containing protein, partial [Spirochaetaceae bacterium]|nr:DUF342 domain-containing protein [Spirochaetaceae bacterium]